MSTAVRGGPARSLANGRLLPASVERNVLVASRNHTLEALRICSEDRERRSVARDVPEAVGPAVSRGTRRPITQDFISLCCVTGRRRIGEEFRSGDSDEPGVRPRTTSSESGYGEHVRGGAPPPKGKGSQGCCGGVGAASLRHPYCGLLSGGSVSAARRLSLKRKSTCAAAVEDAPRARV